MRDRRLTRLNASERHASGAGAARTVHSLLLILLLLVPLNATTGCRSVPAAELHSYARSFDDARRVAEDIIFSARAAAQIVAEHPRNTSADPASELRFADEVTQSRLLALDVVEAYNATLINLAAPTDSATIEQNLLRFHGALERFQIGALNAFTESIPTVGPILAQAVSIIDDLIRRRQFEAAVEEGGPAVHGILRLMILDAEDFHGILDATYVQLEQNPIRTEARIKAVLFQSLARAATESGSLPTDAALDFADRMNRAATPLGHAPIDLELVAGDGATPAEDAGADADAATVLVAIEALVSQYEQLSAAHRELEQERQAQARVNAEFVALLRDVDAALTALEMATERRTLAPAIDLTGRVMQLRQALAILRSVKSN